MLFNSRTLPTGCILTVGRLPTGCILTVGRLPTGCILTVGSLPTGCILTVGSLPTFNLSHIDIPGMRNALTVGVYEEALVPTSYWEN